MNYIETLAKYFTKFPGVGVRQAKRFAYFLLKHDERLVNEMVTAIREARKHRAFCKDCFRLFFPPPADKSGVCEICAGKNTDKTLLMVVEKDTDLENITRMGVFDGSFFVLGGLISMLGKVPPEKEIRTRELFNRVQRGARNGLKEVIVALSVNPEGEYTTLYVSKILKPLSEKYGIRISVPGRGLSTGIELEYSDTETLKNALKNRE